MTTEPSFGGLRRGTLGPVAIAFFVISAAGPLVAMAGGIPVAMLLGNGAGLPAMFSVATLVLILFSVGYTAMAREVRNAGAFYAFAARGLGGLAAGATGFVALLSYSGIQIGLYGLFGAAASNLIGPTLGLRLPWWAYAFAAMASIATLGYRQIDLAAKILGILVACEYLVVLILDIAIIISGGRDGLDMRSFTPSVVATGSPAIGLMMCFTAFVGFEATTIYSEEARDPDRTVPLATYFSVILIGIFYTGSTWAVVSGVGVERVLPVLRHYPDPTSLLFDLATRFVGGGLELAMRILFITSAYAALLAFHNAIARYLFAMGREGLLPRPLGQTHPATSSPHVGSLVQSASALAAVGMAVLAGSDPVLTLFTVSSAVATLGILVLMAIASLATARYFSIVRQARRGIVTAATLSFAAFVGIAALAAFRFDLIAGTVAGPVLWLPLTIPITGLFGALVAAKLRMSAPARFAALGSSAV